MINSTSGYFYSVEIFNFQYICPKKIFLLNYFSYLEKFDSNPKLLIKSISQFLIIKNREIINVYETNLEFEQFFEELI